MNTVDLNYILEDKDLPVCVLCGQPICLDEFVAIGQAGNCLALIHYECGDTTFYSA
jgi:hypothetical protein